MAIESPISRAHRWFTGEDKTLKFPVYQGDDVTPQDVTGWGLTWILRRKDADADPALLVKTPTITGTYNATPALNTQRVEVSIVDTDTENFAAGTYRYSLKRTDDGSETILAYGDAVLQQATAR